MVRSARCWEKEGALSGRIRARVIANDMANDIASRAG